MRTTGSAQAGVVRYETDMQQQPQVEHADTLVDRGGLQGAITSNIVNFFQLHASL
jgi:hypothetical protein